LSDESSPRGRSRWSRTVDGRFVPNPAAATHDPQHGKGPRPPGGSEAILLVEDQAQVRDAVRVILERLGYRVDAVLSADEALRLARASAQIDLLITDVVLPGMNGIALAARVAALRAGVRVLFMSGYTSVEGIPANAVGGERFGFLQKPFSREALARAVRELLDRPR
jgi:DNA-binding NtrC family response regulator